MGYMRLASNTHARRLCVVVEKSIARLAYGSADTNPVVLIPASEALGATPLRFRAQDTSTGVQYTFAYVIL
jgi:hypothetical protein